MFGKVRLESLYAWQRKCLFLAVVLFPLQSLLCYRNSLLSVASFYGQISSVPILIGILLAIAACVKEGNAKRFLFPVFVIAIGYVFLCCVTSIHSIIEYSSIGSFDAASFGETAKIRPFKRLLLAFGVSNEALLYELLVFLKDTYSALREIIFAFGLVVWIVFLSRKGIKAVFVLIQNGVIGSALFLAPYILLELLHLYGFLGATTVLKAINSYLYEPGAYLGWYPPLVSPNQVRGFCTEPSFLAVWFAFAMPFLLSFLFMRIKSPLRRFFVGLVVFSIYFSIWFMTYARTSIVLMVVLFLLYLFISIIFRSSNNFQAVGIIAFSLLAAFFVTSNWGPQDFSRQTPSVQTTPPLKKTEPMVADSVLFSDTIRSLIDAKSRSNPARLEAVLLNLEVFKGHPILGAGDVLSSLFLRKIATGERLQSMPEEIQHNYRYGKQNGVFATGAGSSLWIPGILASRGILGFSAIFLPIFATGVGLFISLFRVNLLYRQHFLCVFISCSAVLPSAFSQGLWFFYLWCGLGLALSIIYGVRNLKSLSKNRSLQ